MESAEDRAFKPVVEGERPRHTVPLGGLRAFGMSLWRFARWGLRAMVPARHAKVAAYVEPLPAPLAAGATAPVWTVSARVDAARVGARCIDAAHITPVPIVPARRPRALPPKPPPLRVHHVAMRSGEIFIPISSAPDRYLLVPPEGPPPKERPAR